MSEQVYTIAGSMQDPDSVFQKWGTRSVEFSEADDTWRCLCTFPWNDNAEGRIDISRIRSLALLGAAVVLIHNGDIQEEYNYLPYCVPEFIRKAILEAIPEKETKND